MNVPYGNFITRLEYKGFTVFTGSKKQVDVLAKELKEMGEEAAIKYLDNLLQKITLRDIGVSEVAVSKFLLGEYVSFEFVSRTSGYVSGYIIKVGNLLRCHIFYTTDRSGKALVTFMQYRTKVFNIAKSLNLTRAELGGSTVINNDVLKFIKNQQFDKKLMEVPEVLGGNPGEKMEVYFKEFEIK